MKRRTESGEMANTDVIRQIMREHSSRENPLGITAISRYAKNMGYSIGRNAIEGFMIKMNVKPYETEEELEELLQGCSSDLREVYFCKTSPEGWRTRGYWVLEALSDSEWMYLIDSVIYSKILTKKEADNLAKRVTLLAGKKVSDLMKYRYRMVEKVRIRIEANQLTQIVDWFADDFEVIPSIAKESDDFDTEDAAFYDIDINSFRFFVLQYSGCIEVIERKGDDSYRNSIKETLKSVLEKYEEDEK